MERPLDRKCPITSRYLELVDHTLLESDLLHENLSGEYKRAVEHAKTAGNSPAILTLRAFVLVETMATECWTSTLLTLDHLVAGRYRLSDMPKLELRSRNAESLTKYIEWAKEQMKEHAIDQVHYQNFSVAFDREGRAARSGQAIEVLTLACESAGILRTSLLRRAAEQDSTVSYVGVVQRFHAALKVTRQDPHAMLKHARNLLSITEQNAPRGWELP